MAGKASPITQSVWKSAAWSACNLAVLGLASGTYLSISDVLLALELGR